MSPLLNTNQKLNITDDSGFLALVNSAAYRSFVDEDWELSQLMKHFIDEMNNRNIIFWSTGAQNEWTVSFADRSSGKQAFREFTSAIEVTDGKLYLTNYEDLTMSAQFEDTKIPADHNSDLMVRIENGHYDLTVRQMFDPEDNDDNDDEDGKVNFEIVIQKTEKGTGKIDSIYWWEE